MKKSALIIANWQYEDPLLRGLVSPSKDAEALAQVLSDAAIGGFQVQVLTNAPSYKVCEETEAFFGDRERDDLLLYYFSGHGVTDDEGQLYYASSNTLHKRLRSTSVAATWVNDIMNECRSRRQVMLLDCCHSGAFARSKSAGNVNVGKYFTAPNSDEGRGKFILTACDAYQYSFEGESVQGTPTNSIFTEALIHGLRTGEADLDGDGAITLDELYDFVFRRVREHTPQQTPRKWASDVEGSVVIATNPSPAEAPLPEDLQSAIDSFASDIRKLAIARLDKLLRGRHRGLALSAHRVLLALSNDDSRSVSTAAGRCLAAYEADRATGIIRTDKFEIGSVLKPEPSEKLKIELPQAAPPPSASTGKTARIAPQPTDAERSAKEKSEAEKAAAPRPAAGQTVAQHLLLEIPEVATLPSAPAPAAPETSLRTATPVPAAPSVPTPAAAPSIHREDDIGRPVPPAGSIPAPVTRPHGLPQAKWSSPEERSARLRAFYSTLAAAAAEDQARKSPPSAPETTAAGALQVWLSKNRNLAIAIAAGLGAMVLALSLWLAFHPKARHADSLTGSDASAVPANLQAAPSPEQSPSMPADAGASSASAPQPSGADASQKPVHPRARPAAKTPAISKTEANPSGRVIVSSSIAASLIVAKVSPQYPPIARAAHVTGVVVLDTVVGRDGLVKSIRVISGPPMLQQAAIDSVKNWRFRPYTAAGQKVEFETSIDISFNIARP